MKIERNFKQDEWVKDISGSEFRESGALWFVNSILHLFGMAITWNPDTDELRAAVVRYRGFDNKNNDKGYKMLTNYLKEHVGELEKDCE